MGNHRISGPTKYEVRALELFAYYGISVEIGWLVLNWEELRCRACGRTQEGGGEGPIWAKSLEKVEPKACLKCGKPTAYPKSFSIDEVFSKKRLIVGEVFGAKSSAKDPVKVSWLRRHGFTMIMVPNDMTEDPPAFKALCQALALALGSSKPDHLWEIET